MRNSEPETGEQHAAGERDGSRTPWLLRIESVSDRMFEGWRRRTGREGAATVTPYAGYAHPSGVEIMGRVMEKRGEWSPLATDSRLSNLQGVGRLFATHERAYARATVEFEDERVSVTADEEGYLLTTLPPLPMPSATVWDEAVARLNDGSDDEPTPMPVLRVGSNARFGVVSDIDDTVMQTGAENIVRNLWTTFTGNALSRHVYSHVPELYRSLAGFDRHANASDRERRNPIFYLSSSPWNLYTLIRDVLDGNGVPWGPIFLRDFGLDRNKFIKGTHGQHKIGNASRLLAQFDGLPFILIGDLGQADAEVYAEIVRRHGTQVAGVILHQPSDRSHEAKRGHVAEMERAGVPTLVTRDYREAIAFASERNWIE